MRQIVEEYGAAIGAMVCVLILLGIVCGLVFGDGSSMQKAVEIFLESICGGGNFT